MQPFIALPELNLVVVDDPDASSMLGIMALCLVHSENQQIGYLVPRPGGTQPSLEELFRKYHLQRGYYRHYKGGVYFLNGLAYWVNGPEDYELGTCYTALFYQEKNRGLSPHHFRPLRSKPEKSPSGWLDPVSDGKPRFTFLHR